MTAVDRSTASDAEFAARIAAFEVVDEVEEAAVERVAQAIADEDGCDRSEWPGMYEDRARAALGAMRGTDPAQQAVQRVDQLTREHFGQWVEIPSREVAGYLYVIRDEFHDGYPSRYVVLVDDEGGAAEEEFTDHNPAGYPKTMSSPCTVRSTSAAHVPGQLALDGTR
jgi:hypothetical protein